ncbi:ABC transporter ATP-binding protein [Tichowtungia aerotolerans]|uniref:ATP-binding cassette domain-containing protein n=1 Tax=Tichowtungia aerotolerans TaxID=2697043 RepID=A0A6P1MAG7_9BACT|nr:ABC transporter ATP-binding protein [Tichowtungia aerotolerans]QHI70917.1 ATP-binding cassette domain-containing protein [Tichowtungia aerotolerans]
METKQNSALLSVEDLEVHFGPVDDPVRAVDRVDFNIFPGEIVALVGESGSGKSISALSIAKLIPQPAGRIVGGKVVFQALETLGLKDSELRKVRGDKISYIFQEPATSLNPVFTVGWQIGEAIRLHRNDVQVKPEVEKLLAAVGLPDPKRTAKSYPHELSGGMQQRAMIAMALACDPDLLVADEPTTALDVTVQKQILELLIDLREKRGLSILLITHNLGIVANVADRVYVMKSGKIVEFGETKTVLKTPQHDYTKKLLKAVPRLHSVNRQDARNV